MSNIINAKLEKSIQKALQELEKNGDIVVCTSIISNIVSPLITSMRDAYDGMYGKGIFSAQEIEAMHGLIREAISNESFFDWEMPILTGFTKEEFQGLEEKLRAQIRHI